VGDWLVQPRGQLGEAVNSLVVEEDVALDPFDIRLLGAATVVAGADGLADPVKELRFRRFGRAGFSGDERRGQRRARRWRIPHMST
jgi:hypothetical protein